MKMIRCAIYTRKSSDEGLEQGFNSLDAQREACAAYILSQASEGWSALPTRYDDGGISGGTLERPALQRLLADVKAGLIDTIVVYKVDRLSRSLFDFAKLVELFEQANTSFVSITQSFNTTSSMGRLTLNMLLSFAQFEREVTAERIRDKIAASKARGMWMGGIPPLGYKPDGRSLAIVDEHAAFVTHIFERYLALGSVRLLEGELAHEGRHAPARTTTSGKTIGARPLSRGQLYLMLKCRTYLGEISHHDRIYPGLHPAIVERELWDAVQAKLAEHVQGGRTRARAASPSLLAGRIVDEAGQPLIATHACKTTKEGGTLRYRYYVGQALHHGTASDGMRVPAREIETLVTNQLASLFDDPLALIERLDLPVTPDQLANIDQRCRELAARVRQRQAELIQPLISQVRLRRSEVVIRCSRQGIADLLHLPADVIGDPDIEEIVTVRLTRSGAALRLVQGGDQAAAANPNTTLIRRIVQARRWWAILREGQLNISELATREQVSPPYLTRVLRLAFLSPAVTTAILDGRLRAGIDVAALTLDQPWPAAWQAQAAVMLPAPR